ERRRTTLATCSDAPEREAGLRSGGRRRRSVLPEIVLQAATRNAAALSGSCRNLLRGVPETGAEAARQRPSALGKSFAVGPIPPPLMACRSLAAGAQRDAVEDVVLRGHRTQLPANLAALERLRVHVHVRGPARYRERRIVERPDAERLARLQFAARE